MKHEAASRFDRSAVMDRLVGRLARPGLVAQALAPTLGAVVLAQGGPDALFGLLVALAFVNVGLVGLLWQAR